jgi:hypothetical protein
MLALYQVRYRWSQPGGKGILVRDEYHRPTASGGPALGAWAGLRGQMAAGGGAAAAAAAAAAARARAGGNRRSIDMGVGGRGVGGGGVMGGSGSKAMVVSSYEAETGDLLLRAKQRCAIMRQAFRVRPGGGGGGGRPGGGGRGSEFQGAQCMHLWWEGRARLKTRGCWLSRAWNGVAAPGCVGAGWEMKAWTAVLRADW